MTALETDTDEVRRIEFEQAPARFARGWHCIGLERSFRDGKPHTITAFGKKLVVFADSKGELNVLDAYHTVWFELHEDLIQLSGRTRLQEAVAGRAH